MREAVGGIVVFWDDKVLELVGMEVGVYSISYRFKNYDDGFVWIFTGVYGPTLGGVREDFWADLGAIRGLWNDLSCIGGDFTVVRFLGERFGANTRLCATMRRFTKVIEDLQLRGLSLLGGSFTWRKGLNNQAHARLDRFLVSDGWEGHFSGVILCLLTKLVSDHSVILFFFFLVGEGGGRGLQFRFENMWLKEERFKDLAKSWWMNINFRGSPSFILVEK